MFAQGARAQGDVYCNIDANGKKEYRNVGSVRAVKLVELPHVNAVPVNLA